MILSRFLCKTNKPSITTVPWIVVMLLFFSLSCTKENKEVVEVAFDPETTYTMKTIEVNMLVSDSGITRYRMVADEWWEFGKAEQPFWYFPEGLYIEQFDSTFQVEAMGVADTAYYWQKKDLLKLIGNVEIENLEGKNFQTSILFWDRKEGRFYSDQFIRIEEEEQVITGIGFEANQDMSKYRIYQSTGIFPVSESSRNDSISGDSTRRRPATAPMNSPVPIVRPPLPADTIPADIETEEIIEIIESFVEDNDSTRINDL